MSEKLVERAPEEPGDPIKKTPPTLITLPEVVIDRILEKRDYKSLKTTSPATLNTVPDDVLVQIFGNLDYRSMQCIRKTCHRLRDFISTENPNAEMSNLMVHLNRDNISWIFDSVSEHRTYRLFYKRKKTGCEITSVSPTLKGWDFGSDFVETFLHDFEIYVRHLKTELNSVSIYTDTKFATQLKTLIKAPLKVRSLELKLREQGALLLLLPLFSSEYLREFTLCGGELEELDGFFETDQWKRCEKVHLKYSIFDDLPAKVEHFKEFQQTMKEMKLNDVVAMKNQFLLPSNKLKLCTFH